MGFPGKTVPAMRLAGAKVQGTRAIARALDALVPSPPLFPADPERRRAVEEAESWGDEVLQGVSRRLIWNALKHDRSTLATYLEGRPAERLARDVVPDQPGRMPSVFAT
jgi:glutathione S-transferase